MSYASMSSLYLLQTVPTFLELVKVLSHFCRNPDPEDQIAFDSAVLLGRLCVRDASAEARLMKALEEPSDSHIKAKVGAHTSLPLEVQPVNFSIKMVNASTTEN